MFSDLRFTSRADLIINEGEAHNCLGSEVSKDSRRPSAYHRHVHVLCLDLAASQRLHWD